MPTIKDIARAAQVSVATVSNVINGKPNVGVETRERILALCKQMHYQPNILARNLKGGRTNTVMFVFSDFQRSFYLRVIHGINDCLIENHISMMICPHTTIGQFMKNGFVDGIIVLDKNISDQQIMEAASRDMPIVTMDRVLDAPHISCVVTDNHASMHALMEQLVQRNYRRFHFVGGPVHTADHMERYETFRKELDAHGIPFSQTQYFQGDYSLASGVRAGKLMAVSDNLPEVVVCANDNMAVGVIQCFREMGIGIPGQVAVAGFDGDPQPQLAPGFLTTANIPRYEMGYIAAETLVGMIQRKDAAIVRKIPAAVQWGEST